MSEIEQRIVKATKFRGDEDDRQEYLEALLRAIDNKLSAEQYDDVFADDEAYEWHLEAVKARDNDQEIPDFPDAEQDETADAPEDQADGEPDADEDGGGDEDGAGDDGADDAPTDDQDEPVATEPEPPAEPAKPAKAKKEPKVKKPSKKAKNFPNTRDYTAITGDKDRFGITLGTKTHDAVMMYEKGCTAKQLEDTLGGRHYNVIKKLIADGHKVEKLEGGVWKLTHRDQLPAPKGKKK